MSYVTQSFEPKVEIKTPSESALLPGARWVPQTFNNCGPATTSMILAYFGHNVSQEEIQKYLRTSPDDTNVFTYEIQDYIKRDFGVESKLLYNGDINRLKTLLANGIYVILENWLHPNEDIGHFTILRGYNDEQGVFIADDSYFGTNIVYRYDEFEATQWKPFNREYLPLYKKEQENVVKKIVGENWDERVMYEGAVKKAQAEIATGDRDMYAYFNLGTSYYALREYNKAHDAFEKSRSVGWPSRMLWYQIQPVQTLNELGKYEEAIILANMGLLANDSFAELHLEKARAFKGLGQRESARDEIQTALFYSPNLEGAKDFLMSL